MRRMKRRQCQRTRKPATRPIGRYCLERLESRRPFAADISDEFLLASMPTDEQAVADSVWMAADDTMGEVRYFLAASNVEPAGDKRDEVQDWSFATEIVPDDAESMAADSKMLDADIDSPILYMTLGGSAPEPTYAWRNAEWPTDINADGITSPLDLLLVINELNRNGAHPLDAGRAPGSSDLAGGEDAPTFYYLDVSGENYFSPLDAILIVNQLNVPCDASSPSADGAQLTMPAVPFLEEFSDTRFAEDRMDGLWNGDESLFASEPSQQDDGRRIRRPEDAINDAIWAEPWLDTGDDSRRFWDSQFAVGDEIAQDDPGFWDAGRSD